MCDVIYFDAWGNWCHRFCSEVFVNQTAVVPATLTYSTFTLTLETGACAITTDFTPNPNNPYDDWLASKGFVCKTPELSFSQVKPSHASLLIHLNHSFSFCLEGGQQVMCQCSPKGPAVDTPKPRRSDQRRLTLEAKQCEPGVVCKKTVYPARPHAIRQMTEQMAHAGSGCVHRILHGASHAHHIRLQGGQEHDRRLEQAAVQRW